MKDSFWYPILFMLVTVIIFVGVLAVMYRSSEAKIEAYQIDSYQKKVLSLLAGSISEVSGISEDKIVADYPKSFTTYVQEEIDSNRKTYKAVYQDSTLAYCFEIGGKGLWGTMKALVSTTTDISTIIDFTIVSQMETPGLGARIEEDWFLAQFRNRKFVTNPDSSEDITSSFEFIAESQTPETPNQLKRVTGATITSDSVVRMLKNEISDIYKTMHGAQQ